MKKGFGIILLSFVMTLAACATDQNNSDSDPLDPKNRNPEMESNTNSPSPGFCFLDLMGQNRSYFDLLHKLQAL